MTLVAILALGLVIGTVLGALGGGGAILTVPALVYLLDQPAGEATTGSLVIVGLTSVVGVLSHARSGNVRWRTGLAFGAAGTLAALLGTVFNRHVAQDVLLLVFAAFMIFAATGMLLRVRPEGGTDAGQGEAASTRTRVLRLVVAGAGVGFLTGFLGVGGGFIIVPALVLALGLPMSAAVGTSLLIIVVNSAVALLARAGTVSFDWTVIAPFTLAAMVGTLGGKRIADRLPATVATRAFAVLILMVAGYTAVRTLFW